ncbi:MAG: Protease 3 precursor [Planctomycetes bacterium ADurb.Bin069]|nr:MAG: Protease 3 precursor [Planctomycetes bacterium ADurb.Bin069]
MPQAPGSNPAARGRAAGGAFTRPAECLIIYGMVVLALAALLAQVPPSAPQLEVLKPSGVRVLVVPRPASSTVAIAAGFRVGSALDGAATAGAAHLLEHAILFRGTEFSSGEELISKWRELGGRFNGNTFPDYTVFKISVRREGVYRALELLREMLFHPVFAQIDVQREADVVCAELATRDRDPLLVLYQIANQAAYGDHNYGLPSFGFPRTIRELTSAALYARLDAEYTPGRLTLAIVGPVNESEVHFFLRETYGSYAPGTTTQPALAALPPLAPSTRRVLAWTSPEAQLAFSFRGPPSADADWLPFEAMAFVLCGGERSILREQLIHQTGIAKRLELIVEPRVGGGLAVFRAVADPGNIPLCEREVKAVLARMLDRSPDREVIDRALNRLGLEAAQRTESPQSLATELVRWDILGRWDYPLQLRTRLAQVPNERFGWIARQYFGPQHYALGVVAPAGAYEDGRRSAASVVSRERRVVAGGAGTFPVVAQSLPESDVFSFALAVRGGLAADASGEEGVSALAARSLLFGEEGKSGDAFRDELLRWGVEVEAGAKRDVSFIRFSAPEVYFEDALASVSRAILDPAFRPPDIERARQDLLVETAGFPSLAEAAERALWKHAMEGTPYAVLPPGSYDAILALRPEDLASKTWKQWDRWWRPEHFAAAVCGPRNVDELVALIRRAFASAARQPPLGGGPAEFTPPRHPPRTVIIDKDYRQTERPHVYLLCAWFVPESTVENLSALLLLREILAGGPGSRLWRLRQDEGLLYHLQGKVVVSRQALCVQIAMVLPLENLRLGRNVLLQEVRRAVEEEELTLARKALERENEERRERGLALADEEAWFALAGWERDAYHEALRGMSPAAFKAKTTMYCTASCMWTIAVGPRDAVSVELSARE